MTPLNRALAATAALAWLGLGTAVTTDWPHADRPATSTPATTTERVCWHDGTAALITPMPGGRFLAVSDGTCTYHPHNRTADPEGDR